MREALEEEDVGEQIKINFGGRILEEEIGTNGFGYDPIFYSTEAQKPMGLIDDYSKDLISHRGKAFRKLIALLMPIEKNAKEDNK